MIGLPGGANDFFASSDAEVFLVLKAFFDGSQRQNLFVLAGYVGHVRYWRRFGLEWNNVCFKYGIKSGLHMKHFAFSRGEFEKFNGRETLRRSFLADLLNVLYRKPYRFLGIGSAIDLAAYQDWREKFSFTDWRSEPYFSAFRDSVATTIEQPLFKHLPRSEKMKQEKA